MQFQNFCLIILSVNIIVNKHCVRLECKYFFQEDRLLKNRDKIDICSLIIIIKQEEKGT